MPVEAFANNWAYLKVELNNLERLLLAAVAKQKKDQKESDRLLRTPGDRATKHWLQGLMHLEGPIGYDSPPPQRSTKPLTYSQQLENRIQATQQAGKALALPLLCDRLNLTIYEKNLILLGIAPEIHRRYAKLYEYLNGNSSHLVTIDLSLRLLCRNDQEWRLARAQLKSDAPLRHHQLIDVLANDDRPFLQHAIRLSPGLVNYLLADQTLPQDLAHLLQGEDSEIEVLLKRTDATPEISTADVLQPALAAATVETRLWTEVPNSLKSFANDEFASDLVLPAILKTDLQQLAQAVKFGQPVDDDWGFGAWHGQSVPGQSVMLVGPAGTGKAAAAAAIAQAAGVSLVKLDLSQPLSLEQLCLQLQTHSVPILLVRHADRWLGRKANVSPTALNQFFQLRQRAHCLTLFSMRRSIALPQQWRHQMVQKLLFKPPTAADRAKIWQTAFPPQMTLDAAIDWDVIACHALTGGAIVQAARAAVLTALAEQTDTAELRITIAHIQTAIAQVRRRMN
ncbi:AAA family ATPase [filamentous cyanobacterium LEGE 11480]|uniref:AAA family ATPase n=1 Tax=Romeriopsis navalis LEGE 11480 TaxID=2777977 RepID=A0A928VVR3_9CYAN|nr:AAA family ATPase [Romeriopsis navalis]MBE9033104.1 AAA family ATPase [Romeriopsis navalis LEGE 11480]